MNVILTFAHLISFSKCHSDITNIEFAIRLYPANSFKLNTHNLKEPFIVFTNLLEGQIGSVRRMNLVEKSTQTRTRDYRGKSDNGKLESARLRQLCINL